LLTMAQPTRSLINSGGGYHIRSSEHENTPLYAFPIQYSSLSPSCHAQSQFKVTLRSLKENQ
jgi:hypothetical protein